MCIFYLIQKRRNIYYTCKKKKYFNEIDKLKKLGSTYIIIIK